MDVTRRCDYACRIIRAAYRGNGAYRSVSEIAAEEGIPYAFARSIQHDLVQGGLISTVRGARGGLRLKCDPQVTTLLDVLEAVQGPVTISQCAVDGDYCDRSPLCEYNRVWRGADSLLAAYFGAITLVQLFGEADECRSVVDDALRSASEKALR